MSVSLRSRKAAVASLFAAAAFVPIDASAISVEVAKKCDALVAQRFPPREPGNPAAGSKSSVISQRSFFSQCVANDGNPPDDKNAPADKSAPAAGKDAK
jgi:hypothetical protein